MDLAQLLDLINRIGGENAPTDQELNEARSSLRIALHNSLEGEAPDVEAGEQIRAAIDDIDAELVARAESRAQVQARAAALLEGQELDQTEEEDPDGDEEEDAEEAPEEEPETATSIRRGGDLRTALSRSSVRAEANTIPDSPSDIRSIGMGPAASVQDPNMTLETLAATFHRFNRHIGRNGRQSLIRLEKTYPEERQFGTSVETNSTMVNDAVGERAIVASGGICGPLDVDFSHPICGERGRPIRDALPAFQADRGGLRYSPAATLADLEDALTIWTAENDESPSGVLEKACPHVTCPDEVEAKVDAIVWCLTVGNFQAKFNPEFWRSRLDLVLVGHDRLAEQTLFAQMQAAATNVSWAASEGGTAKEALRGLDRAIAGQRSRLRLFNTQLRWIAPLWLQDALRSSITNNARGGDIEEYSVADSILTSFFTSRGVTPVWSPDLQVFAAQGAGALTDFPSTATTILYPEGAFLFLDGGTLDLGIEITDSTLNATNDRQAFAETFEQATFRGCEALELVIPIEDDCDCVGSA